MSGPKVAIGVVGISGWYPRGVARFIESMHEHSPGLEIRSWVNCLPPGAPACVRENGVDYGAYTAKPFALDALTSRGTDIGILVDAAFYAIRHIQPLIDHICEHGYYLCKNGASVGEWSNDRSLKYLGTTREDAMEIEEVSSYCVGIDFRQHNPRMLCEMWKCVPPSAFMGPHTNGTTGRNPGWCSDDPRVKGHRHDQTVLSILADKLGMRNFTERPKFTAYRGSSTSETVLENNGGM